MLKVTSMNVSECLDTHARKKRSNFKCVTQYSQKDLRKIMNQYIKPV